MNREEIDRILLEHKKWLDDSKTGKRADFTGADLRGADLRRADLKKSHLFRANLADADLKYADLRGAFLAGAILYNTDLKGADLSDVDLSCVNFRVVDLTGADLRGADLRGVRLEDAKLIGADLTGANLSDADLFIEGLRKKQKKGSEEILKDLNRELISLAKYSTWATIENSRWVYGKIDWYGFSYPQCVLHNYVRADYVKTNFCTDKEKEELLNLIKNSKLDVINQKCLNTNTTPLDVAFKTVTNEVLILELLKNGAKLSMFNLFTNEFYHLFFNKYSTEVYNFLLRKDCMYSLCVYYRLLIRFYNFEEQGFKFDNTQIAKKDFAELKIKELLLSFGVDDFNKKNIREFLIDNFQIILKNNGDKMTQEELNKKLFEAIIHSLGFNTIKTLVEQGADVKAKNRYGSTVLHWAVQCENNLDVVKYLVEQGAEIKATNRYGRTVLHGAVECKDNLDVVKFLVEQDADVDAVDRYGRTVLHDALYHEDIDVYYYLKEQMEK